MMTQKRDFGPTGPTGGPTSHFHLSLIFTGLVQPVQPVQVGLGSPLVGKQKPPRNKTQLLAWTAWTGWTTAKIVAIFRT